VLCLSQGSKGRRTAQDAGVCGNARKEGLQGEESTQGAKAAGKRMKEYPIMFTLEDVRRVLDGKKTVHIVPACPQPPIGWSLAPVNRSNKHIAWKTDPVTRGYLLKEDDGKIYTDPFGDKRGEDLFWVKESAFIALPNFCDRRECNCIDHKKRPRVVGWAASMDSEAVQCAIDYNIKLTPAGRLPLWASRILLQSIDRPYCRCECDSLWQIKEWEYDQLGLDFKHVYGASPRCEHREQFYEHWNSLYTKPRPIYFDANGVKTIHHYVSYPIVHPCENMEVHEHKGKPWLVYNNPRVWITHFKVVEVKR
jgi:hypothetical protein